jgi:hypothetical protein
LLKALVVKAGLSFDEIVGAYSKRGTKISNSLLSVHKDATHATLMCGSNPHFAAQIVDENGNRIAPHGRSPMTNISPETPTN